MVVVLVQPLKVRLQVSLLVNVLVVKIGTLAVVMASVQEVSDEEERILASEVVEAVSEAYSGTTVAVTVTVTSAAMSTEEVDSAGADLDDGSWTTVAVTVTVASATMVVDVVHNDEVDADECSWATVAVTVTVESAFAMAVDELLKVELLIVVTFAPPLGT